MIKEPADFSAFLENFDSNPFHKYLGLKVAGIGMVLGG